MSRSAQEVPEAKHQYDCGDNDEEPLVRERAAGNLYLARHDDGQALRNHAKAQGHHRLQHIREAEGSHEACESVVLGWLKNQPLNDHSDNGDKDRTDNQGCDEDQPERQSREGNQQQPY